MKTIGARLSNQPVAYSAATKAVLLALVLLHVVTLAPDQLAGIVAALDAVLGLIVWSSVSPAPVVAAQVRQGEHAARARALADVASLAPLPQSAAKAARPVKKAAAKAARR